MKKYHSEGTKQNNPLSRTVSRRNFLSTGLKVGAAAFSTSLLPNIMTHANCDFNVLFIMIDDFYPLLGCYGFPEMHTPNIDRLAQRGTLFNRAYCQYPLCNPSRTSILTGLRPETTGVISNTISMREKLPNVVTLPQHFKEQGYHTQSVGKITHTLKMQDDDYSWSVPSLRWPIVLDKTSIPSWQALDAEDDELRDGKAAHSAVEVLQEIQHTPFFLAVGFRKPHLPLHVPKKYYELYNNVEFKLPATNRFPTNAPSIVGGYLPGDLKIYQDITDTRVLSEAKLLELIKGYAASTSFMDAQVGRVLNQLDALKLTEKTVIVLCSDHGFHVGVHGTFRKNSLFEVGLQSALIVSIPGQSNPGTRTDALVELVDIYPTLCDACNLPIRPELEGLSVTPVMEQPTVTWKSAAFSQNIRWGVSGKSIRQERYRYTEWGENGKNGIELYDYDADPNETVNIAEYPENTELAAQLSEKLRAGWRESLPDVSEQTIIPQTLPWDINNDGIVNIKDLILISDSFGVEKPEYPKADVNKDGSVDIIDLLYVASHLGESCISSAPISLDYSQQHVDIISEWITEAYNKNDGSDLFREGIARLESLRNSSITDNTTLYQNYPNPFNPETWIPYDLAQDSNVDIYIYDIRGQVIRKIRIGFQNAGSYRTKEQAAYWDGYNSSGERVANGIYFYSLKTDHIKATRKMTILK